MYYRSGSHRALSTLGLEKRANLGNALRILGAVRRLAAQRSWGTSLPDALKSIGRQRGNAGPWESLAALSSKSVSPAQAAANQDILARRIPALAAVRDQQPYATSRMRPGFGQDDLAQDTLALRQSVFNTSPNQSVLVRGADRFTRGVDDLIDYTRGRLQHTRSNVVPGVTPRKGGSVPDAYEIQHSRHPKFQK